MDKLYTIDDFYVGKLNISCKQGNLLIPGSTDFSGLYYKQMQLINNGAINYHNYDYQNYIKESNDKLIYEGVYTLFLKQNANYLCLHDGNTYTENGNDYCSCLTSFKNYLPKVDFIVPMQLTIADALNYFNIILKNSNGIELYNKEISHSINDYFIGSLNLLTKETNANSEIPIEKNFINSRLLANGWWGCTCSYNGDETKEIELSHDLFVCLFIKIADRYYNIKDFHFYTDINSNDSFCYHLIPFKKYIEDFNITPKEILSIQEAANVYQRLNNAKTKVKAKKFNLKDLFMKIN